MNDILNVVELRLFCQQTPIWFAGAWWGLAGAQVEHSWVGRRATAKCSIEIPIHSFGSLRIPVHSIGSLRIPVPFSGSFMNPVSFLRLSRNASSFLWFLKLFMIDFVHYWSGRLSRGSTVNTDTPLLVPHLPPEKLFILEEQIRTLAIRRRRRVLNQGSVWPRMGQLPSERNCLSSARASFLVGLCRKHIQTVQLHPTGRLANQPSICKLLLPPSHGTRPCSMWQNRWDPCLHWSTHD